MYKGPIEVGETYPDVYGRCYRDRTVRAVIDGNVYYTFPDGEPGGLSEKDFRLVVTAPVPPDPLDKQDKLIHNVVLDVLKQGGFWATADELEKLVNECRKAANHER